MAFFDDIGKSINNMTQSARKAADVARIQHQISQKQAEFDSFYHQIGQLYYSCHQRGLQPDESIEALCDRVTATAQEIEKLRLEIDKLRNVRRCPVCGNQTDRESKFCNKCGAKLEVRPAKPEKPAEPEESEAAAEDAPEKDVYINWPDAGSMPDAGPMADGEETGEETGEEETSCQEEAACECGTPCDEEDLCEESESAGEDDEEEKKDEGAPEDETGL